MDYTKIATRSLDIVWQNKYLVFLGFVFWLFGGRATSTATLRTGGGLGQNPDAPTNVPIDAYFETLIEALPIILSVAIVVGLLLLVMLFVGLVAEGATIASINYIEINGDGSHSLGESWGLAWPRGLQLFLITIISRLPSVILIGLFIGALIPTFVAAESLESAVSSAAQSATIIVGGIGVFCINLLIAIPMSILRQFAVRACIVEENDALQAYTRAWEICTNQLQKVAGAAVVRFLFGAVLSVVSTIITIVLIVTCIGVVLVPVVASAITTIFIAYWSLVWQELAPLAGGSSEVVVNAA